MNLRIFLQRLIQLIPVLFGVSLVISRLWLKLPSRDRLTHWGGREKVLFAGAGVCGGLFASQIGTGIDIITFIVLTTAYGVEAKVSTFTSIVIMSVTSVVGAILHAGLVLDAGSCLDYWLVAVPVVIVGAPLGALVTWRLSRDFVVNLLLALIALEVVTTFWLVSLDPSSWLLISTIALASAIWFGALLRSRLRTVSGAR